MATTQKIRSSTHPSTGRDHLESSTTTSLTRQIGLFALLLVCSLAVFLLGANYYKMFPSNGNSAYAACLSIFFLIIALIFRRSERFTRYWPISYAFFIASVVNLISDLFAGYNTKFVQFFGSTNDPNKLLALAKFYDMLLVVIPIIVLTLAAGADLGTLFLQAGNQYRIWGVGIGALVLVNFFTSVLIFFGPNFELSKLGSAVVWGIVFSFSNSILEELWIRGLFLKKLIPLLGVAGSILLTTITFASAHFLSIAFLPAIVVPIFVANTFTLGLACAVLMIKTDGIWGAYLIHAAADLFLFIATLAVH